jgi:hypothetical protein
MGEVQKPCNSECYTQSSEPFRICSRFVCPRSVAILCRPYTVHLAVLILKIPKATVTTLHAETCPDLLHLRADILSSPPQQCVRYLISHSPSAGEFRELFDCPSYMDDRGSGPGKCCGAPRPILLLRVIAIGDCRG